MGTNQNLKRLGPRVKLFKRQMKEWEALLILQKQVRSLTNETSNQRPGSSTSNKAAIHRQITKQAVYFTQLLVRQTEERQQMKARHQQEETELEQAINTH